MKLYLSLLFVQEENFMQTFEKTQNDTKKNYLK